MTDASERFNKRPWRLRDVPDCLEAANRKRRLSAGMSLLVFTDLARTMVGARVLRQKASYERRSRLAYDVMAPMIEQALGSRERGAPPIGVAHLIRAREGRVVAAPDDGEWERTLLWACGLVGCYTGDLVIVTPHGWRVGSLAGWSPTLTDLSGPRLRSVPTRLDAS
jgi:hypothetical protein